MDEKWYSLCDRLVSVVEKIVNCTFPVISGVPTPTPLEPAAQKPQPPTETPFNRAEILNLCKKAGIPVRNPGSSKDKRTDTLQKEYNVWLAERDKAATQQPDPEGTPAGTPPPAQPSITKAEIILALQEVRKKYDMIKVVEIIEKVAKVKKINDIPSELYPAILKEVDSL